MEMPSKTTWVIVQNLIRVIFKEMDLVWLKTMWEDGGSACADMIEILISLDLLKLKSLDSDLLIFCEQCCCILFWRCIYFPVDGLVIITFDDYLSY
jgi:hypothetical protein